MPSVLDFMNSFGISDMSEEDKKNGAEEILSQIDLSAIKGTVLEGYLMDSLAKTRGEFQFSEDGKILESYKGEDLFVSIPEGIEEIGKYAFNNCNKMRGIDIPKGVRTIGNNAFFGCDNLQSIELPDSVQKIEHHAFNGCRKVTTIDLPNSLKIIEGGAFNYLTSLEKIYIPSSVEYFCDTFYYTPALQEIHVSWRNLDNINIKAFDRIDSRAAGLYGLDVEFKQTILYVPHGMVHTYRHHPAFRNFAIILPE